MAAFDYKKEYKEFYLPPKKLQIIVVPPLEGFWWQEGRQGIDYSHKEDFRWISLLRLPEFVTREEFEWVIRESTQKKGTDFSKVEFLTYEEGLCV